MKKIEIIADNFSFLLQHGFTFTVENKRIGYECWYLNDDGVEIHLSESEDYRDEDLVNFVVKRKCTTLISYHGAPVINAALNGANELFLSVDQIYKEAQNHRSGFTKVHYSMIIKLYSEFVKSNLNQILLNELSQIPPYGA